MRACNPDSGQPENHPSNRIAIASNKKQPFQPPIKSLSQNGNPLQPQNAPQSFETQQLREIFEQVQRQSIKIMEKVNQFVQCEIQMRVDQHRDKQQGSDGNSDRLRQRQKRYSDMQEIIDQHINQLLHPTASTAVGEFLLANGKFICAYIQIMTKNQKKDYLRKYLFDYFSSTNKIVHDKIFFDNRKKQVEIIASQNENEMKKRQQKKWLILPQSPSTSQPGWSTKVEQDSSSPLKQSLHDSQFNLNKSTKKAKDVKQNLKRVNIKNYQLSNQQQQATQSQIQVKSRKKTNEKYNPKMQLTRQQPQKKTKANRGTASRGKTSKSKYKSQQKLNRKYQNEKNSKRNFKQKQKNDEEGTKQAKNQNKLGSFYHYQLRLNPKNHHAQLNQVRTSARLSHRRRRSSVSPNVAGKKSNGKAHQRSKSKSKTKNSQKSKQKKTKKRLHSPGSQSKNKQSEQSLYSPSSHAQQKQQKQLQQLDKDQLNQLNQQLQVSWIKNHLQHVKIHNVQLYSQFNALTDQDQKITQLLLEMQKQQGGAPEDKENEKQTKKRGHSKRKSANTKSHEKKSSKKQRNIQQSHPQQNTQEQFSEVLNELLQTLDKQDQNQINPNPVQPQLISIAVPPRPSADPIRKSIQIGVQVPQQLTVLQKKQRFQAIKSQFQIPEYPIKILQVIEPNINDHYIYALVRLARISQFEMGTPYAITPITFGRNARGKFIKQDLQTAKDIVAGLGFENKENIAYVPRTKQIIDMIDAKLKQMGREPLKGTYVGIGDGN